MNKKLLLVAGVAITSAGIYSPAVMAVSTTGSSTARVVQAMTITAANALAFGDLLTGASGTVILDTANGVTGSLAATGTQTSGSFTISGAANAVYTVTLDASTTITDGTDTMNVTGINHDSGLLGSRTLSGTGADTLSIGGTLTVAGTEGVGSYSGTYNVTVDYQQSMVDGFL